MPMLVAPSLLAADFANLQRDIEMLNQSQADWIHFDVMDGQFVPNISFGLPVCHAVKRHAQLPIDVHLMIVSPDPFIPLFAEAGAASISVHFEACPHLHRTIQLIKAHGCKAGVAVNPHTPVSLVKDMLPDLDFVNMMSVNPGFGGQSFLSLTLGKIEELKSWITQHGLSVLIEVDGGVNLENYGEILKAGADILVMGNAIFSADSPHAVIEQVKKGNGTPLP